MGSKYDEAQIQLAIELFMQNRSQTFIRKKTKITELELYRILDERGIDVSEYKPLTPKDKREIAGVMASRKAVRYWRLYDVGDMVVAKKKVSGLGVASHIRSITGRIIYKNEYFMQILRTNGKKATIVFGEIVSRVVVLQKIATEVNRIGENLNENGGRG